MVAYASETWVMREARVTDIPDRDVKEDMAHFSRKSATYTCPVGALVWTAGLRNQFLELLQVNMPLTVPKVCSPQSLSTSLYLQIFTKFSLSIFASFVLLVEAT